VPIMVGDQVVYAGTLFKINPLATVIDPVTGLTIPDNTAANTYISAHTLEDVLGVFTAPGIPPAYVTIEDFLIGTNGAAVQGLLQEASTRLTVVGFTTDPTRLIDIYAQDVNPCTGVESLRLLATTDPATQAIVGRFVHRVLGGEFMPPTRNYVMKTRTQLLVPDPITGVPTPTDLVAANGILTGQFLLPNFEYIFPENHRLGDPFIPFNFQDLPFLAQGSGPVDGAGTTSPLLAQLDPWPGSIAPPPAVCTGGAAPIVTFAINPVTVGTGTQVTINPTVALDPNSVGATFLWTQIGGLGVAIAAPTASSLSFTAPNAATTLTFHLAVTDQFGTSGISPLGNVTVNVTRVTDTVTFPAGVSSWVIARGKRGPFGKLNATATSTGGDPTVPLVLTLEEVYLDVNSVQATISWGTGSADPVLPGTFNWVEDKGAPQPLILNVFSSRGGFAQAHCTVTKNTATQTVVTCDSP